MKARARLGAGELEAAIVLERIEPGSLDLARLLTRVLATPYRGRGEHARTVALAYDWLYERWEPGQRAALRDKLARGLDHLVDLIRVEQLSPYHARLYGGPLPTRVAANLALYGDDPRGELYMRFTRDLWLNRTLPVWRQIMGRHGGWHESGELLTNGLGRAIYQLPALWLAATGENWFDEPGIRGFCDFLVYQRRPDGTNSPRVPDAIPLALHYRHRPAYNLHPPGRLPAPSVWPWGPLTDAALLEPNADTILPLARHFDGLGLIVARSDWSPAATRVSFLAGDNYWSQPAPDQGSFSISRGAALTPPAPRRASACQGDSQNLVTVTAPASSRATGQRQVGSGQGGGPAPLDLAAWQARTGWFHTGRVLLYRDTGDAVVVVADLASAYNDAQSAHGPSARGSRRIQGLRRTFIYDRVADTVIVRDRGASMQSASRQHWLLHGTAKPAIDGRSFRFDMAASSLHGLVLLPRAVRLETSEAADDATTTETRPPCRPAPFWRLTLSAAEAGREHEFLLALVPRGRDEVPLVPRPLAARGVHGIELDTPRGMRRWWFAPQGDSLRLESANQRHDFAVTGTPTGN